MTDNAWTYTHSNRLAALFDELGIRHLRTRPRRPQTNGKAERFIGTLQREWAYGRLFRSNDERLASLPGWVDTYNRRRPHAGLDGQHSDGRPRQQGRWERHLGSLGDRRVELVAERDIRHRPDREEAGERPRDEHQPGRSHRGPPTASRARPRRLGRHRAACDGSRIADDAAPTNAVSTPPMTPTPTAPPIVRLNWTRPVATARRCHATAPWIDDEQCRGREAHPEAGDRARDHREAERVESARAA